MSDPAAELRYAVLRHEGIGRPHFDLLFETAPASPLAAWRAERWPVEAGDSFEPLPDHRPIYLDYEGPISGNRGTVRRVRAGTHHVLRDDPETLIVQLEDGTTLHLPRRAGP